MARATGISAFEIREISSEEAPDRIKLTNLSIIVIIQSPEKSFALEYQILEPTVYAMRGGLLTNTSARRGCSTLPGLQDSTEESDKMVKLGLPDCALGRH